MSLFVSAFDAFVASSSTAAVVTPALRGENGTLEYSAEQVGDSLVAFFFALVRNIPDERLHELFVQCITTAKLQPRIGTEVVVDLFVLAFQTRDCRGGKGERALFYKLFLELYKDFPQTCVRLLPLIAEYGSYRDFFQLLAMAEEKAGDRERDEILKAAIALLVEQLNKDETVLTTATATGTASSAGLSLCAKYCPREGSSFAKKHKAVFQAFLAALLPDCPDHQREVAYRKRITRLTAALEVVEVKMCAKQFSALDFTKIPALCMQKYRKAFLNEKLKEVPTNAQSDTGNRFPEDVDRVQARQKLRDVVLNKSATIKGGQLYPHELSAKYMNGGYGRRGQAEMSTLEKDIIQAQWVDLRTKLVEKLQARRDAALERQSEGETVQQPTQAVDFGKLLPLVDVSGSMGGTPMEVAIALGILISEINQPAFRDRVITFHSDPSWVSLSGLQSLEDKVHTMQAAPWGMSTNLEKAFDLIEKVIRDHRLPASDVPDLIIFSDMQFDSAVGNDHLTQLQRIEKRFHKLGIEVSGSPYPTPRIVFWNLRGDTRGFPATASAPNVQMLSGYSPSLFNALVSGDALPVSSTAVDGDEAQAQPQVNPYDTMRSVLDDERYDAVREALSESREGSLAKYRFEKPVVPTSNAAGGDEMDVEDEGQAQDAKKVKRAAGGRGGGRGGRGGRGRGRR